MLGCIEAGKLLLSGQFIAGYDQNPISYVFFLHTDLLSGCVLYTLGLDRDGHNAITLRIDNMQCLDLL